MISSDPPAAAVRREEDVLAGLEARLPGYVAGWQPAVGSAAAAVQRIGAAFGAIVDRALNEAVARAPLAFLEACGESRLPAQAAEAPVVFTLSAQSPGDAPLPAGTRIGATVSATGGAEPPVFTVGQSIALVRATLASLYSVDPGTDRADDHSAHLVTGFTLFTGGDVIEHAIYLGHDHLFKLPPRARIILSFDLIARAGERRRELRMKWEYRAADGWRPLAGSIADMLITDGRVDLLKAGGPPSAEHTILGRTSHWLRGSIVEPFLPDHTRGSLPVIDTIRASLDFGQSDLRPDAAFLGSTALDVTAPFFPFGPSALRGATFLLGSSEAFGRPGARVEIKIALANLSDVARAEGAVAWEYYDGTTWKGLGVLETTHVLIDTKGMSDAEAKPRDGVVAFVAPADWKPTTVSGVTSHFLRVRLDADNVFGTAAGFTSTRPIEFSPATAKPPIVRSLRIVYAQLTAPVPIDHCVTANASVLEDRSEAARFPQRTFVPFVPSLDERPAVYFGFDRPLPAGLVSIYVGVPSDDAAEDLPRQGSDFLWEYASASGWSSLEVRDGTLGFRRSGFLQWVGPFAPVASEGSGGTLYRVRARLKQGARLRQQHISGVWLNAVMATDASSYGGEILGYGDGLPRQSLSFPTRHTPVHGGELIEVREWTGHDRSFEAIASDVAAEDQRTTRDPASGDVVELWIRWQARPHLFTAKPADRVYTLERVTGLLRFGDGTRGLLPPVGAPIRAAFTTGGGLDGNVPAKAITELRAALPLVATVSNPRPARGGSDTEAIQVTQRRGGERLRHRDQAIAPRDFEWLAVQASPAVARARCLPITGPGGTGQRGWVTVIIVPNSRDPQPQPDDILSARVRDYLSVRVPAAIARRIRVRGPIYQAIAVVAEVVPLRAEDASLVETTLRRRLDTFLHPLIGGPRGEGWEVGQPIALSLVAAVIESTPGVDYAREVMLQVDGATYGDEVPGRADALVAPGDHEIRLTIGTGPEVC